MPTKPPPILSIKLRSHHAAKVKETGKQPTAENQQISRFGTNSLIPW